jgi:hypothetical protein
MVTDAKQFTLPFMNIYSVEMYLVSERFCDCGLMHLHEYQANFRFLIIAMLISAYVQSPAF